ncbi:MAG: homocysteine S-methyltransferase family protein [Pseudomonadota bacterium]
MSVTILDGGMGEAIFEAFGKPDDGWPLLGALERPDVIANLHAEHLRAGADIITTATYHQGRWHMNMNGAADAFGPANRAAARAAADARERVAPGALIAGGLGPVRHSYEVDSVPPPEVVETEVLEQALVLAADVDFFLCETLTTSPEALAALKAARGAGRPVWVALTLHEMGVPTLRGGEPIGAVATLLYDHGAEAVLINCTTPEQVDRALPDLARAAAGRPFGAYANAFIPVPPDFGLGGSVDHPGVREDLSPSAYAAHAAGWAADGATIIGGCCGVGPAHIKAVADTVRPRP